MASVASWEYIKDFYQNEFGIEDWVVELYANLDVLLLCASGASNESISKFTEIPLEEVKEIIRKTFMFDGWTVDLGINPYKLYCDVNGDPTSFKGYITTFFLDNKIKEFIFTICKTMKEIEEKIKDEWI